MSTDNATQWHERTIADLEHKLRVARADAAAASRRVMSLEFDRDLLLKERSLGTVPSLFLPEPGTAPSETWCIPLRVGEPSLLSEAYYSEPHDRPRHYRMYFRREYGRFGTFWRAEPFCTEVR